MTIKTTLPADLMTVLRRMRSGPVTTLAVSRGAIECRLGGCPIESWTLVALIAEGLVEEREVSDDRSEYHLTTAGRELANGGAA